MSALAKQGNELTAHSVAERLTRWARTEGITLLCTSLLDDADARSEGTPLAISTVADTWIHLTYQVQGGERNRALSIVKSRGTAHSNQVRELLLSDSGITLSDVFTAGGEVLMGTLRYEREEAVRAETERHEQETRRRLAELELLEAELVARRKVVERELEARRAERERLRSQEAERRAGSEKLESEVEARRQGTPSTRRRSSKGGS